MENFRIPTKREIRDLVEENARYQTCTTRQKIGTIGHAEIQIVVTTDPDEEI